MNPINWFTNAFTMKKRKRMKKKELKYRRSPDERLCTDSPGTPEWNRFWETWEESKQYNGDYVTTTSAYPFLNSNSSSRKVLRSTRRRANLTKIISKSTFTCTRGSSSTCSRKNWEKDHGNTCCSGENQMVRVTKVRVEDYKITSCGFPLIISSNCGVFTIGVGVGQPNGLFTTRVSGKSREIIMEVVGVQDHLIEKWLVIRARTATQIISLSSPTLETDGYVVFTIP